MAGNFLHNAWYCAALSDEVTDKPFARMFLNEPVVMYRREDGEPVALADICAHRRAPLSDGCVQGDNIQCPYHGIIFDSEGKAVWAQGREKIHPNMKVRKYPLVDKHGFLWIWMGDPARADETTMYDCSLLDLPGWAVQRGEFYSRSAAMMAIDNIMDLSHTAFVHAATIGAGDDLDPEALTWERRENYIKGTRKATRMTPSPAYLARGAGDYMLTQVKTMSYEPPYYSNVDIFTKEADCEPGAERFNEEFRTFNMMTPETDTSHFYFYANCRNFRIDDEEFGAINLKIGHTLLAEDVKICEAVQRRTLQCPSSPEIDLAADAGGLQARRIIKRLIAQEREEEAMPAAAE
ncbi:MAG: aromatic ring-hydroxylating dioxygenase subunit alpha [Novosphingobium sp.]|nr:aromatic ring-hydroxylating dioxygenase subunit alpha [Novosphingobium sp.]